MIKLPFQLKKGLFLALTGLIWAVSLPSPGSEVNLRFFHSDCRECEETKEFLEALNGAFPEITLHDLPLEQEENYLLLLALEKDLNSVNEKNAPVSLFLFTNAFYGITAITNSLPPRIIALLGQDVPLYEPGSAQEGGELASERMEALLIGCKWLSECSESLLIGCKTFADC